MTKMAYYQKTWRLFYSLIYGGPKVSRQFQFTHGRYKKINGIGMSEGLGFNCVVPKIRAPFRYS